MGIFKKVEDKKYEPIPLDLIKAPDPKKETIIEEKEKEINLKTL